MMTYDGIWSVGLRTERKFELSESLHKVEEASPHDSI